MTSDDGGKAKLQKFSQFWWRPENVQYITVQYTVQCSTVQYSTVQYNTIQYSTVQYSTVQYSTVQSYVKLALIFFHLNEYFKYHSILKEDLP